MSASVYDERDGRLFATELARGPWDPGAQHGGAPAAIMVRAFEGAAGETELTPARITFELVRPVPLGELTVQTRVIRAGKRIQLMDGTMRTPDGTEVIHARGLWVAPADVDAGEPSPAPPGPETGTAQAFTLAEGVSFPGDAMEIRFIRGSFFEIGPATAWFRLRYPLLAGEEPSPMQRLAAAADFPNGISSVLPWEDYVFINPDLTIYIERAPVGEWICVEARTTSRSTGAGLAEAVLYDANGRVGRSLQSLLVARR